MLRSRLRFGLYVASTSVCLVALGWLAADVRASGARALNDVSTRVANLASHLERREVVLRAEGESYTVQWRELGFRVDRPRTENQLLALEPSKSAWDELLARFERSKQPPPEAVVTWRLEPDVLHAQLEKWSQQLAIAPKDAVVDVGRYVRDAEVPGRALNLRESVARASELQPPFDDQLQLAFDAVAPRVTLAHLPSLDPRKVLSRFDTDFSKKRGPRIHNIRTAAAYLDGLSLGPGETLSFNRTVGERVASRGFIDAPVIVNDVMESGMGGGVCQVATALHAAAVLGGFDIVERRSHSRPSGYASLGLDATVIDGVQDLRVRNPYDTAVYVRAYLPSRYVLRVELLGVERAGSVKHTFWVAKRYDYTRRIVLEPSLAPGTFKRGQKGGYGYDTVSTVTHTDPSGQRTSHRYNSKYYPVPEVFLVGPGTNANTLPPLPKGAFAPTQGSDTLGADAD